MCAGAFSQSITHTDLLKVRLREGGANIYENDAYKEVVTFALKLDADLAEKYKQTANLEEELSRLTSSMERHDNELLVCLCVPTLVCLE